MPYLAPVFGNRQLDDSNIRLQLRRIFDKAIESAAPAPAVLRHLPEKPGGRCIVVGAGKASAAMAAAIDAAWPDVDLSGVVSTRYGHAVPAGRIRVLEAGHPVPDQASEVAARQILNEVSGLSPEDLVIALISGGGSSTMAFPIEPLSLREKQEITQRLLDCGAPIREINTIRKHLSRIKGGHLAEAAMPARLLTLLISDVPGDDPADIASGPTIPPGSRPADALELIDRYAITVSPAVRQFLSAAPPVSASADHNEVRIIASPSRALAAMAKEARQLGFTPIILGDSLEGESREVGRVFAGISRSVRMLNEPARPPAMLLSGGETTVTIGSEGAGRGGRNTEFLLALAIALQGEPGIWALAGDSDGIDGTEDAAGAVVTPDTLVRARAAGFNPQEALRRHDSYSLFAATEDLVLTGPTLTNVNDIRIVMVL